MTNRSTISSGLVAGLLFATVSAFAQKTTAPPPTDTAAQSSPVQPAPKAPVVDAATQSSPIPEPHSSGIWLSSHTAIPIALNEAIDSGKLHNGQTVRARLTASVSAHGKTLAVGTPVELSVIATVPAGKLTAVGEFSLQLESIGGVHAFTDIQTFRGKPGHRDVADAAPAIGTDAGLPRGAALTFHVQPPPVEATGPPPNLTNTPGGVTGVASGNPPPQGSSPMLQAEEQRGNNGPNETDVNKPTPSGQTPQTVTQPNTNSHSLPGSQPPGSLPH